MNYIKYLSATNVLLVLCVIVFVLKQVFAKTGYSGFELFYFESPLFNPVQLFSHLFLHGSISHLLLNMLGLWMFGTVIERVWGTQRFLVFYFACGIGAALIYLAVNYYQFQVAIAPLLSANIPYESVIKTFSVNQYYAQFASSKDAILIFASPVVGASGAIYGILVAFAFLFPNHKVMLIFLPVPIAAKFFVPVLLCIDLLSGVTGFSIFGANVAHAAHIGGAIVGMIFVWVYQRKKIPV